MYFRDSEEFEGYDFFGHPVVVTGEKEDIEGLLEFAREIRSIVLYPEDDTEYFLIRLDGEEPKLYTEEELRQSLV